jgi:hypothetical protein
VVRIILHHSSLPTTAKKPYGPSAPPQGADVCVATAPG